VQERDEAGNWSYSGSRSVTIDVTPPGTPVVGGFTPANITTPQWTWVSGGDGSGLYRYKLDDGNLSVDATETSDNSYTPGTDLEEGAHTLYVQELDEAGNWSDSGSFEITIDLSAPDTPVVSGTTPTNDTTPVWTWSSGGDSGTGVYRYKLDHDDLSSGAAETIDSNYTPESALNEGAHTLYVQERDEAGNWSASGSFEIIIDLTAPETVVLGGDTPTLDTTPTWTWVSGGGGGNGLFRYKLDDGDLASGATETASSNFTPESPLDEGPHALYIQETDAAGNWSAAVSYSIDVDLTAPAPPVVAGLTPTNDTTPAWEWSSVDGDGTYRYKLDDGDFTGETMEITDTGFTPGDALAEGTHILYVQERDLAGNWSDSGSFAIEIDLTSPNAPSVSGASPTNDTTPTWAWISGGGGANGTYRHKLDDDDLSSGATQTTNIDFTPDTVLSGGEHTLYVQERDEAGNWSSSGSYTIEIDLIPPNVPVVSGTTPTNDTTPEWSW